jgi:hypothetical protein
MPTTTKTFIYTGTINELVIPAGTTHIDVHLWGGAGGGGGADAGGPGGYGAAGHYVTATSISMASNIGDTIQIAVGGSGGGGASGGGAPGGGNGKSKEAYSGGNGGNAGPTPYSGAGGGAGGATVVIVDGTAVAVAGGGGGGAGSGAGSNGGSGLNTNSATAHTPATLGEEGKDHSGDGGGGGAGGGGVAGGKSGNGGNGDQGGSGGYAGTNNAAGGTEDNGSGVTPGGTGSAYYSPGVAVGGSPGGSGANGRAVVIFTVGVQASVKVGGAWKDVSNIYTKVSGAWKEITAAYVKVSGAWKDMFNSGLNFTATASGFGDTNGGNSSGSYGTGGGGGCFIAGTLVTMADGSQKAVELVDIRDEVAVGGFVFATGKFLIDDLFEYKGIKVSGTHMVKEDGSWTRVADSKYGKSLGDDEHIVYVFGSEFRRIMINGIEFTDYFEIDEKQKLLSIGEKFFGIWREHDRQTQVDDVKILNND